MTQNITDALKTDIAHSGGDYIKTPGGDLGTVSGLANYKLALFHRLMTVPGSLVHRPTYGVGATMYQNAPSSFAIQQKFAGVIEEQFAQDPRTEKVLAVSITSDDENPQLTLVKVSVKPIGYSEQQMIFTPFSGGNS